MVATRDAEVRVRTAPGDTRRVARGEVVLGIAVLAQLAAVLAWPRPVTVDGPAHLLGATVLAEYLDPRHPIYQAFYQVDPFPAPNVLTQPLLAGLVRAFSLGMTEKIVIAAYVVLFPLALWYAVRGVRRDAGWLAIAALPLTFHYLFFYGFFNFCLGVVLSLFAAGFALRHADAWGLRTTSGLAVLFLLTYLAHLVPFALALVFVAALAAVRLAGDVRGGTPPTTALLRRGVPPALAAAPGLLFTGAFWLRTAEAGAPSWDLPPGHLAGLLTLWTPIVTFNAAEAVPAAAAGAVLLALTVIAARRWGGAAARRGRGALLALGLALVLYLAAPNQLGIHFGFINERVSYFPVLFLILWLAAQPWGPKARTWATAGMVAAAVALAVVRLPALAHYDRLLDEYYTVTGRIEPGSTLVAVRFDELTPPGGPVRNSHWDPVRHAESRVAAYVSGIDVGHYEAVLDYFPTTFRERDNLRRAIDPTLKGLEQAPPRVDLSGAVRNGRPGIDYVLVVAPDAAPPDDPRVAEIRQDLRRHYRHVADTAPTGLVEVWRADQATD